MDFEKAYDKIYKYAYFRVGDRATAEDITQEAFLRFLANYG
ncbi:MAG: RNA polymerase subunit sigma-24, partial [Lachnospiraceae bacterium]|nr:RNA polymerase subunit sigma-24 [Lachnospiraceae bacterium]